MKYSRVVLVIITILFVSGCDIDRGLSFDEYINKANLYINKGDTDKAISCYLKALKIKPTDANTHFALGKLYNDIWKQSYDSAYNKYSLDTFRNEKRSMNLIEDLKKYGLKNEYKDMALHEFLETLKNDPNNSSAREYIANDYLNNKHYNEAIDQYKILIKLDKTSSLMYWHIADAYLHAGKYDMAIENINLAFGIENNKEYYYFRLGQAYYKMNLTEKAFQMLTNLKNMNSAYYDDLLSYKYSDKK